MNYVRFSGKWFIYLVLIALGGGVLMLSTMFIFSAIGLDPEWLLASWILPCGVMGAVIIAGWLVEAKQSVIENMAPVLTLLFTPLFTPPACVVPRQHRLDGERDRRRARVTDRLRPDPCPRGGPAPLCHLGQGSAGGARPLRCPVTCPGDLRPRRGRLGAVAILARISEFGFSPNRVAALGENLILVVNLGWSAVLYARFVRRRGGFAPLERWQTAYLPVYAGWAWIVVVIFPLVFSFQ